MPSNPTASTQPTPRIGSRRRRLAIAGVLTALTAAGLGLNGPAQAPATRKAPSAPAPTTVIKETVVKATDSDPALPIALSAAALAVALGAAAHAVVRRSDGSHTPTTTKPGESS